MKRMDYARSLGLAKAGPGRPSRAALDAIQAKRDTGYVFDDDVVNTPTVKTAKSVKFDRPPGNVYRTTGPVETHDRSEHVMGITLRYDMDQEFEGIDSNGKKHTVNGRQACSCGYSLVGHICHDPSALIGFPLERIKVTPKKKG
jgi:hypothetical protein